MRVLALRTRIVVHHTLEARRSETREHQPALLCVAKCVGPQHKSRFLITYILMMTTHVQKWDPHPNKTMNAKHIARTKVHKQFTRTTREVHKQLAALCLTSGIMSDIAALCLTSGLMSDIIPDVQHNVRHSGAMSDIIPDIINDVINDICEKRV